MKGGAASILVLLVSLALMIFLQQKSTALREAERAKDLGVSYLHRSKMPTGGFDAVISDFVWMRTNLKREPKAKKGLSDQEKKAFLKRLAERNFVGYSKVVSLDPTFKKAYNFAILRIMNDVPDQAIALAEMAMLYVDGGKKEFAELAGHIASTIQKDHNKALGYYKICVEGSPEKDYLGRRYLRTILRTKGIDPYAKELPALAERISLYHSEYESVRGDGHEGEDGVMEEMAGGWIKEIVIDRVRQFMGRAHLEKVDAAVKSKVEGIYASYRPEGHSCSRCYTVYVEGDRFCSTCGLGLEVFGACKRDNTILKGKFCHSCGLAAGANP